MRRIVTAITGAALALSMVASAIPANAAVAGYDSAYLAQSDWLVRSPGQTGSWTVIFQNTGTTTWTRGTSTEVEFAACLEDKVTCNAQDASEAPFNSGWLSTTRYADMNQSAVAPGQAASFTVNIAVPANQPGGTHHFNGAVVKADTGADIRNEGAFFDVLVTGAAAATTGIVVTPAEAATNSVSTATGTTNQNRGARSYTATIASSVVGTCVDIALIFSARVSTDGTRFRDTEATTSTADDNNQADDLGGTGSTIEVVQGVGTGADAAGSAENDYVNCVTIPANRTITFTIDSDVPGESVRPVVFVDTDSDNALDLTGANDADGRKAPSETAGVGGTKTWIAGISAATAAGPEGAVCRKDTAGKLFSLDTDTGTTTGKDNPAASTCDVSFTYDANDDFFLAGVPITMADFEAALSRADHVDVGLFSPDAAARSSFDLEIDRPGDSAVSCSVSAGNTVRFSITPVDPDPLSFYTSFTIQRRTAGTGSYTTIATPTADAETGSTTTFEYTQAGEPAGTWDYRALGTVDGDTENETDPATPDCAALVVGTPSTSTRPLSTDLFISTSRGLDGQLDTGDIFKVVFDQAMNPDSTGDVILVQDADGTTMTIRCNAPASTVVAGEYRAICNFNEGGIETVKNAPQAINTVLTVTITDMLLPTATTQAGTVSGMHLPTTVTDQGGIRNTGGLQWDPVNSPDRVIDIE